MITATGKLQSFNLEFVGTNDTAKLEVLVNANTAVVPFTFIGDRALNAMALLGDPGLGAGQLPLGTIVRVTGEQGFRYWEGDEERGPKTFTTELSANELIVVGSVAPESTSFMHQGVLFDYQAVQGQGQNGTYTRHSVKLLVPSYKKGELQPQAAIELNVNEDLAAEVSRNVGNFVVVAGTVGSFEWTPKRGKNIGVPQRSLKYHAAQVVSLSTPAWITAHDAFQVPAVAPAAPTYTPPAAQGAVNHFDTPLF